MRGFSRVHGVHKKRWRTRATLTLHTDRGEDITAAMVYRYDRRLHRFEWQVDDAVDEEGHPVALTTAEHHQLCRRAEAGEDETGVEP